MPIRKAISALIAAPLFAHSVHAEAFFTAVPAFDCNEEVEYMLPAVKDYCCKNLAEAPNMRPHCPEPEESTCDHPCSYKGFNTTCGDRIQWAAANEKYDDNVNLNLKLLGLDQCALSQMQVKSECLVCWGCTVSKSECRQATADLIQEKFNVDKAAVRGNVSTFASICGLCFLTFVVFFATRVARFKPTMERELLVNNKDESDGASGADV